MARILGIALVSLAALGAGTAHAGSADDDAVTNPAAWWLDKMDVDNDGRVTLNEFDAGRARQFVSLDTNGDEVISVEEREAAIEAWNRQFPDAEVELGDGAGDVTRQDFEIESETLFRQLDADRDNIISESEIRAANVAG